VRYFFLLLLLATAFVAGFGCGQDDDDDSGDDDAAADDDDDSADDDSTDDDDDDGDVLLAGVADDYLDVPIGLPMGGFGMRVGPKSPYSQMMGGTSGYLDRPNVKTLVLQRGGRRIVIAKGTLPWVTESLRTQVVELVLAQTGIDLDRTLIFIGTHTHSGPSRFMAAPTIMGVAGMDIYHQAIVDRLAASVAETIVAALDDLQPAKIGFGYREPFDPDYLLTADRRCNDGPGDFKENRLWVGRVENSDGEPLAVLVGMAMHGVIYGYADFQMTGDAPDAVERAVEKLYDRPVTAIYVQGSAGDQVPQMWGYLGHRRAQINDWIGYSVAQIVHEVEQTIVTQAQPELKIITQRYTHDRETLGYQPGEFGAYNLAGDFQEYQRGAMLCGTLPSKLHGSIADCDAPDTTLVDGYLGCLIDLNWPIFAGYVELFQQSPVSVAQIGDQYFFTVPGEPLAHLAVDIRERMAEALDVDVSRTNTIGYAQNYIFYIPQDWNWWQGGGETEGSLFGWRMGPWLTDEIGRLALRLGNDDLTPVPDPAPKLYYQDDEPFTAELSERGGEMAVQPKASYRRLQTVKVAWHGGHPEVDRFTVTLQRLEGDAFVDVLRSNGAPYTEKGWEMSVHLDADPSFMWQHQAQSRDFVYTVDWETMWDDPAGTLRFAVNGLVQTDQGVQAYTVYSDAFELQPTDEVTLDALSAQQAGEAWIIRATAAYPPDPVGARRMRSPWAGGGHPAVVSGGAATAVVEWSDTTTDECSLTYDAGTHALIGQLPQRKADITAVRIAAGAFDDGYGNTNADGVETP